MRRDRLLALAALAVIGVVGVLCFRDLEVRSGITDFVPSAEGDADLPALTRALTEAGAARTIALTLGPTDEATAAAASASLIRRLEGTPGIARLESGAPEGIDQAFYELYFSRRYGLWAGDAAEARALTADAALAERAAGLRRALTGPTAMLVRRIAPEDPLQVFPEVLRRLRGEGAAGGRMRLVEGRLVVDDPAQPEGARSWGVVLVHTTGTTFSADLQGPVLEAIDRAAAAVQAELGLPAPGIEQASVHRFAVRAERGLRADTQRISTLSTVGIVLLFLLLFRGPRYLLLGGIPLAAGTVAGAATVRLVSGDVHGITLAFGSSMLGVGIDFVGHYVSHHVLAPDPAGPEGTMRRIWPGLLLGASSTILGIGALGLTTLPGMQEMALFSAAGVTGALLATRFLVPPLLPEQPVPSELLRWLAGRLEALVLRLLAAPQVIAAPALAAAILAAHGLSQLTFEDDLRALNGTEPALAAEDRRVRERIAQGEASRFAVALADDDEQALLRAEAMDRALDEAEASGELGHHRSVTTMLRSAATQSAVWDALAADASLAPRALAALEHEGFVPAMFGPFAASLGARPSPLTAAMLLDSPIAPLLAPFRLEVRGDGPRPRIAYLALLGGVREPFALDARLRAVGARLFDQADYLRAAYGAFRRRAILLVGFGLVLVLGLCGARYRSARLALASIGPALLASAATLGFVALTEDRANLMHLVACLLVLSMGEDYAVFLLESRQSPKEIATTFVGVLLACVTTVLSFGLLALSSHPALRALGTVTSLGVLFSLLLSPLALVIAPRQPERASSPPSGAA